jgi:hypothetical protein
VCHVQSERAFIAQPKVARDQNPNAIGAYHTSDTRKNEHRDTLNFEKTLPFLPVPN